MVKVNTFLNKMFIKNKKKISIYGFEQLNDNSLAIFKYLVEKGYYNKYKICLLYSKVEFYNQYNQLDNVILSRNKIGALFHLFTSKYIIHAQGMGKASFVPVKEQIIFNIWHGSPLKNIGNAIKNKKMNNNPKKDTFFLAASPYFKKINMDLFGYNENQIVIGGNPRNDKIFEKINITEEFQLSGAFKKIVLFMPTFRKSNNNQFIDSNIEFPIITENNIDILNNFLDKKNILLIIKPHPYQSNLDFLTKTYSNIKCISNEEIRQNDIELYQILGSVDLLITDYSSVYFDFLLTNKPICFVVDDINEYADTRGFVVEDPKALMPGEKVRTLDELMSFLEQFHNNVDNYMEERKSINNLVNSYTDNSNCERLLNQMGIYF